MSDDTGDLAPSAGQLSDEAAAAAFQAFISRYDAALRRSIRVGPHGGELNDLVQGAYLVLWEHRATVLADPGGAFAFCQAVANNLARKHARRAETRRVDRVADFPEAARGLQPDPADLVIAAERGRLAAEVFASLSPGQRRVWWLCEVEGLSIAAAAAAASSTPAAVEKQLSRARQALRKRAGAVRPLVASLVLVRLRRPPRLASERSMLAVPSYVLASLTLLVATGGQALDLGATNPERVRSPGRAAVTAIPAGIVREPPGDAATQRRRQVADARVPARDEPIRPPRTKKVGRCLDAVACLNHPTAFGHTLWLAQPGVPGVLRPTRDELSQRVVPVCDIVDPMPNTEYVGCERHGSTIVPSPTEQNTS